MGWKWQFHKVHLHFKPLQLFITVLESYLHLHLHSTSFISIWYICRANGIRWCHGKCNNSISIKQSKCAQKQKIRNRKKKFSQGNLKHSITCFKLKVFIVGWCSLQPGDLGGNPMRPPMCNSGDSHPKRLIIFMWMYYISTYSQEQRLEFTL